MRSGARVPWPITHASLCCRTYCHSFHGLTCLCPTPTERLGQLSLRSPAKLATSRTCCKRFVVLVWYTSPRPAVRRAWLSALQVARPALSTLNFGSREFSELFQPFLLLVMNLTVRQCRRHPRFVTPTWLTVKRSSVARRRTLASVYQRSCLS